MRVVAGRLGGRTIEAPPGNKTHPMGDKIRGALFSSLGDIESLTILDAFSGSGALSVEALSRGAAHATAVEIEKSAHQTIQSNAKALHIETSLKAIRANVSSWSDNNVEMRFDVVICDPPYDKLQLTLLQKLVRHVAKGGVFVLSWPGKVVLPEFVDLSLVRHKTYGDAQLAFYKKP